MSERTVGVRRGLGVVLVALCLGCAGSLTQNPETIDIKSGKGAVRYVQFEYRLPAEIWVTSAKDSDVNLYVYDDNHTEVARDVGDGKDCHVTFTPVRTQIYKVEIRNTIRPEPEQKRRNVDNRCTLKWK